MSEPIPDLTFHSDPRAVVERGRWAWSITIQDGLLEYGPGTSGIVVGWTRWTRKGAEKKARRVLARYRARYGTKPEQFEVT